MSHRFLAGLSALSLGLACLAAPAPAVADPAEIKTFVWKVLPPAKLGLRRAKPDYLLGTMHVPLKPGKKLPAKVESWIRGATKFVMEVDLGPDDAATMRKYAAIEPGQDLKALVPPAAWPKIVAHVQPLGIEEDDLRALDPWYVALTYLPTPADGGALMDSRLRQTAEAARVPVAYLETAADQLGALDGVAMKEDLAQLLEVAEHPEKPAQEMAQLTRAYEAGDLKAVESYLFDGERMRSYPDFYEKVFHRRNHRWMPALERSLQRDQAFVAVGLGHLLGAKGLLALLGQRGWRVTREAL